MSEVFNLIIQLLLFIGIVYLVGYLISLVNRTFYKITGGGRGVCLATGFIGTPIHELSHAIMCLVFFFRIEEIKLFQTDDANGVLGYVKYRYNRKNLFQRIGTFFVGIAPIMGGSLVLMLLMKSLAPNCYYACQSSLAQFTLTNNGVSLDTIMAFIRLAFGCVSALFTNGFGIGLVVFLVLAFCIALHMNLSGADIKGGLGGLPILIILVGVVATVLYYLPFTAFLIFNNFIIGVFTYIIALLFLSLIFALVILAFGFVFSLIKKVFGR